MNFLCQFTSSLPRKATFLSARVLSHWRECLQASIKEAVRLWTPRARPFSNARKNTATKARDDEALLALTQTWAQTSNGAFKAPDDLRCEKFAETLEPPSRFSQPPHSEKGVCGMEKHLSRIHSGDLHKARSEDGRTEYYAAFFWRVGNTSCYVSPK